MNNLNIFKKNIAFFSGYGVVLFLVTIYANSYFIHSFYIILLLCFLVLFGVCIPGIFFEARQDILHVLRINFFLSVVNVFFSYIVVFFVIHGDTGSNPMPAVFSLVFDFLLGVPVLLILLFAHVLLTLWVSRLKTMYGFRVNVARSVQHIALLSMVATSIFPGLWAWMSFQERGGVYYSIGDKFYALERGSGIYNEDRIEMKDVDKNTFEYIEGSKDVGARDKNHFYLKGEIVTKETLRSMGLLTSESEVH